MEKIILDIYRGNYSALDRPYVINSKERNAFAQVDGLKKALEKVLPKEHHSLLEKYYDAFMDAVSATGEQEFVFGYRMGVKMMIAAWPDEVKA